ncbi:hypothetical protein [Actinoplanes awajinensis]|uniref:Uncharacterized protein n=1 Tax=Actinoplanes awajinensis subsp. mycoplanecinus TaxID=135947 RepID=A0A0X3UNF8_9ACTN|nr:hypothetical protein [Actinoplanes awajinensis]KUL34161.1 hypothetical protein ADL15_16960 [Actinoplanes awajinensis subsp. mycoplanecinus]
MNINPNANNADPRTSEDRASTNPYHYYLSVWEFNLGQIRTLEMEAHLRGPIRTFQDVQGLKQWLRDEHGFGSNPQVSFSLLRNDLASRAREKR